MDAAFEAVGAQVDATFYGHDEMMAARRLLSEAEKALGVAMGETVVIEERGEWYPVSNANMGMMIVRSAMHHKISRRVHEMKNIELFDEYTARIFADLYRSFPVKRSLDARKLSGHEDYDDFGRILNERGDPSKEFEVAYATIEWLFDTGYIRGHEPSGSGMSLAVLSPMGLAVLKSVPSSLKAGESMGDKLSKLLAEGATDSARDLVKAALAAGASAITSNL